MIAESEDPVNAQYPARPPSCQAPCVAAGGASFSRHIFVPYYDESASPEALFLLLFPVTGTKRAGCRAYQDLQPSNKPD